MTRAYEEIIDFIAHGSTPRDVAAFTPSQEVRDRVADLIYREKLGTLQAGELDELNHFMELEHIMRMAKARARKALGNE